jgi:hypothetical protein
MVEKQAKQPTGKKRAEMLAFVSAYLFGFSFHPKNGGSTFL